MCDIRRDTIQDSLASLLMENVPRYAELINFINQETNGR